MTPGSGAVAACLVLLSRAKITPTASRRRSLRVFGGLHLAVFIAILASVAISYARCEEQTSSQVLYNSLLLVVYNLPPLAWILRFQPLGRVMDSATLERYGITTREKEIIELIKNGHTNREIADLLFISLATVNDHNYKIFRKTGVRNRVELSNLFGGGGSSVTHEALRMQQARTKPGSRSQKSQGPPTPPLLTPRSR